MDIAGITAIISSLGTASTLAGALLDERDRQKAMAIQIELSEKILAAQVQLSEVLTAIIGKDAAIQALSQRNRDLEAAQREKERYALAAMGSRGDLFAYRLRPAAELVERQDEPPHFLCQVCFDAGKKVVLQAAQGGNTLICHADKGHALVLVAPKPVSRSMVSRGPQL